MVSQDFGSTSAPAPLDRAEVEAALRPFGQSRMLPRAAYVDPDVFAWEQRHFFGGGWLCVARSDQLPQPGDQRAEATGPGGILLVRGEDGVLRAFANSCRHRGHELLPCGQGAQGNTIICPYHAWTYSLDGELRAAAGFRRQP
jgi:Rieske 2Fe-2S family protein